MRLGHTVRICSVDEAIWTRPKDDSDNGQKVQSLEQECIKHSVYLNFFQFAAFARPAPFFRAYAR